MLNALIIGGTGLISTGITKHLRARGVCPDSTHDTEYQRLVERAPALGLEVEDA